MKVAVVDANHFLLASNTARDEPTFLPYLETTLIANTKVALGHLYPESHTRNAGYVENVATIKRLIEAAGFRCTVGSPELDEHGFLDGITGPLMLDAVTVVDENLLIGGEKPCLVLLNNDLTEGMVGGLGAHQVSPPPHMGWQRRRKASTMSVYNRM